MHSHTSKSIMSPDGIRPRNHDDPIRTRAAVDRTGPFREPETIEEDLELVRLAMEQGLDPFPERRDFPWKRVGRLALAWFMVIMMVSWVSRALMRFI